MITESEQIAQALDRAADIWPTIAAQRTELLRRIIEKGIAAIESEADLNKQKRIAAVLQAAGKYEDLWSANWRAERDAEWPE